MTNDLYMKQSTLFFAGFTAAAVTFATLTLVLGHRHYGWAQYRYAYRTHRHDKQHSCDVPDKKKLPVKSDSTNTY
jgi:hypothetical protein